MEWNLESFDSSLGNCLFTCQQQDWISLDSHLDLVVKKSHISLRSIVLDCPCLQNIYSLFRLINDHYGDKKDECYYHILCNIFRLLRNCCAGCSANLELIEGHSDLLFLSGDWLSVNSCHLNLDQSEEKTNKLDAIKCLLQFYANITAGPESEKRPIRKFIFQVLNCKSDPWLIVNPDDSLVKVASAVIYHCLLDNEVLNQFISNESHVASLINGLLLKSFDDLSEWSLFIVELLLGQNINFKSIIDQSKSHLNILDVIWKMVTEDNDNRCRIRIKENNINILVNLLKEKLLMLSQDEVRNWTTDEVTFIARLISIVCEISCNETYQSPSLDDDNLFRNTIGALKRIHFLHKAKALRDRESNQNSEQNGGNLATLKKDLVRLVSNLAHNRPNLQLIASQIDAIPLILDLHSFDMNNPFIREWATYATRNLLFNCNENMEIARGLKDLNLTTDSDLMDRLNLNLVDGKLVPKKSPEQE